jgi:hypothetical protein
MKFTMRPPRLMRYSQVPTEFPEAIAKSIIEGLRRRLRLLERAAV